MRKTAQTISVIVVTLGLILAVFVAGEGGLLADEPLLREDVSEPPEKGADKPDPYDESEDLDGDGLRGDDDLCPDQPEDLDGYEDDDGCPDLDNDFDGVVDQLDLCPLVPEDPDGFEDDDGCPDLDNDGDGIEDDRDDCPDEPEYESSHDDFGDGCPDPEWDDEDEGFE